MDISGIVYNVDDIKAAALMPTASRLEPFSDACQKVPDRQRPIPGRLQQLHRGLVLRPRGTTSTSNEASIKSCRAQKYQYPGEKVWMDVSSLLDSWVSAGYLNSDCVASFLRCCRNSQQRTACSPSSVAVPLAQGINPDVNLGMIPAALQRRQMSSHSSQVKNVIWVYGRDSSSGRRQATAISCPSWSYSEDHFPGHRQQTCSHQCNCGSRHDQAYLDKYSTIEGQPGCFDRAYCFQPVSWDVICATGQGLAQKSGAVLGSTAAGSGHLQREIRIMIAKAIVGRL